jgi:hypothetical protein
MRIARLRAVLLSVGVALLAVLAVAVIASAASTQRTAAQNRAAAARDATALRKRLVLSIGARSSGHEPAGDHGLLATPATTLGTPALVDRHGFWIVPSPLNVVEAFVAGHQRSITRALGTGTIGGPGIPDNESLTFTLSHPPAGIESEALIVDMVALPDGQTAVRADAQVVWTVPRTAAERVPAGVHEVDISRAIPGRAPSLSIDVTAQSRVDTIVAMIDRLPAVQPGVWSCPEQPAGAPQVTFVFRSRHLGPVLARASENADVSEPTGPCAPLTFSVRGRAEPALLHGASFLHAVGRLIGATLRAPAPAPAG